MKKILKFLFPVPSLIIMALAGISFSHSDINGSRVLFFDWIGLLMVFFVMFVIPFDMAIWLMKNIYKILRNKVSKAKNKRHLEENFELKFPDKLLDIPKTESIPITVPNPEIDTKPQNNIPTTDFDTGSSEHTFYPESESHQPRNSNSCNIPERNKNFDLESFMRECNAYVIKEERKMQQEKNDVVHTSSFSENINQSLLKMPTYYSECNFDNMGGHEFEHFCASILEKNGFESVDVTRGSGDQGIDIVAIKEGIKYGIQCKCHSSDIGNKAVQEAIAGKKFYNCHVGVVLTNQYFTKPAKELAEKTGILLWDRTYLEKLIKNPKE